MAQPHKIWVQVQCPNCGKPMAENRIEAHRWYMHGEVVTVTPRKLTEDVGSGR